MSDRFGSNTGQVERFIERLYHLQSSQWNQIRKAIPGPLHTRDDNAYASARAALRQLVGDASPRAAEGQDLSRIRAGSRPEQQNIYRALVHCRTTCVNPIRLPEADPAVTAAVNAAGALAAREWLQRPDDLTILYAPFAEVIPLHTLD